MWRIWLNPTLDWDLTIRKFFVFGNSLSRNLRFFFFFNVALKRRCRTRPGFYFVFVCFVIKVFECSRFPPPSSRVYELCYRIYYVLSQDGAFLGGHDSAAINSVLPLNLCFYSS